MIMGATRGFDRQKERGRTKCVADLTLRDGKKIFEIKGGEGNCKRLKQRMHKSRYLLHSLLEARALCIIIARPRRDKNLMSECLPFIKCQLFSCVDSAIFLEY